MKTWRTRYLVMYGTTRKWINGVYQKKTKKLEGMKAVCLDNASAFCVGNNGIVTQIDYISNLETTFNCDQV